MHCVLAAGAEDSRAAKGVFLNRDMLTPERLDHVRALNRIAAERGQALAQMAVAWVLRDPRMTSALVGASSVGQLEQTLGALQHLEFSEGELAAIDRHAVEAGINLWASSSRARTDVNAATAAGTGSTHDQR